RGAIGGGSAATRHVAGRIITQCGINRHGGWEFGTRPRECRKVSDASEDRRLSPDRDPVAADWSEPVIDADDFGIEIRVVFQRLHVRAGTGADLREPDHRRELAAVLWPPPLIEKPCE